MTRWRRFDRVEAQIFADALADGDSVARAAKRAGRSPADGERQLAAMIERLGWQAA